MSTLDQRKKSEENRYAREQELEFKINVRGNKLFGLWLAAEFGLADEAAQSYALQVVDSGLEKSDEEILAAAASDRDSRNVDVSDHRLATHLTSCREDARKQIMGE